MKKGTTEVKQDSNIARILEGKTRGYHEWYVRHILKTRDLYTIKKTETKKQ